MEPIIGHWLDPAIGMVERTPNLGVRLEGVSAPRLNSQPVFCSNCEGQLALFATYQNSAFIRFSRFALLTLEFCPVCSKESDGSPGENGFLPLLRQAEDPVPPPSLPEPVYFHATPTGEPSSEQEFQKWNPGAMRAKLGGRQVSIQPPLEASCNQCFSPLVFVASVDESWGPGILNFGRGFGYLFVCRSECSLKSTLFYWDCC
jgi:hypothetical protein